MKDINVINEYKKLKNLSTHIETLSQEQLLMVAEYLNLTTEATKFKGMDVTYLEDKLSNSFGEVKDKIVKSLALTFSKYIDVLTTAYKDNENSLRDINLPTKEKIDKFSKVNANKKIIIEKDMLEKIQSFYQSDELALNTKYLKVSATLGYEFNKLSKNNKFDYYIANSKVLGEYNVKYLNMGNGEVLLITYKDSELELTSKVITKVINAPELAPLLRDKVSIKDLRIDIKTILYYLNVDRVIKDLNNEKQIIFRNIDKIIKLIKTSEDEDIIESLKSNNEYQHELLYAKMEYALRAVKDSIYIVNKFT